MSKKADKKFFILTTIMVIGIALIMIGFYFMGAKFGENPSAPLNIGQSSEVVITAIRELFS